MFMPMADGQLTLSIESMLLENRFPQGAPILSEKLLGLHARFSKSLQWIETTKYIGSRFDDTGSKD
jgi:hypothetical protein